MQPVVYMLLSAVSFAAMGAVVKYLSHMPFWQLVLFRSLVVCLLCSPGLFRPGRRVFGEKKNRKILFLRGLFGTVGLTVFYRTLHGLEFGTAVTIQYTSPLFTMVIAALIVKREKAGINLFWGLLALAGVAVMYGFDTKGISPGYALLGLTGAFFSGCAYNCISMLKDKEHALVIMLYLPFVTIPVVLIPALLTFVVPSETDMLLLGMLGFTTYLGQYFLTRAYQTGPVSRVAVFGNLNVCMALVAGVLLFDEIPEPASLAGMILVLMSVYAVQRSGRKQNLQENRNLPETGSPARS